MEIITEDGANPGSPVNKLSSQDRSLLIRFASSLPSGSPEKKTILSGLVKTPTPAKKVLAWLRKYRAADNLKVDAIVGLEGQTLVELNPGDKFLEWTYIKRRPIYGGMSETPYTYCWVIGADGLPDSYQDGLGNGPGHVKYAHLMYK